MNREDQTGETPDWMALYKEEKAAREKAEAALEKEKADREGVSCVALVNVQAESFRLAIHGTDSSHLNPDHREAHAQPGTFKLSDLPEEEEMKRIPSLLMQTVVQRQKRKRSGEVIPIWNESDVSELISMVLKDATVLAELQFAVSLEVRREQSIFRARPDHAVVYDTASNLPVLTVEDKKPSSDIFTPKVIGQVFDYATAMRAFGHKAPFVVLTCFQDTRVYWLDEQFSNQLALGKGRADVSNQFNAGGDAAGNTDTSAGQRGALPEQSKTPSPHKFQHPSSSSRNTEEFHGRHGIFTVEGKRNLQFSQQTYGAHELAHLLYSAIACGIEGVRKERATTILRLSSGTRLNQMALKLTEDTYKWGTLSTKVGMDILPSNHWRGRRWRNLGPYYVVGVIGAGETSKVFHALRHGGSECVIKMYVERKHDDDKERKFVKRAREKTLNEVNVAKRIYGDDIQYQHTRLNKHWCVVMPLFAPIEKRERKNALIKIRTVLKEKFAPKGLKFSHGDIRWRHVGKLSGGSQGDPSYILFDLADLESTEINDDRFVEEHLGLLEQRADAEETTRTQMFAPVPNAEGNDLFL